MSYRLIEEGNTRLAQAEMPINPGVNFSVGDIIFRTPETGGLPHRIVKIRKIVHRQEDTLVYVTFCTDMKYVELYSQPSVFGALNNSYIIYANASKPLACVINNLQQNQQIMTGSFEHTIDTLCWDLRNPKSTKVFAFVSQPKRQDNMLERIENKQKIASFYDQDFVASSSKQTTKRHFTKLQYNDSSQVRKKIAAFRKARKISMSLRMRKSTNLQRTSSHKQKLRASTNMGLSLLPIIMEFVNFPGIGTIFRGVMSKINKNTRARFVSEDLKILANESSQPLDKMDAATQYTGSEFMKNLAFIYWDAMQAFQDINLQVVPGKKRLIDRDFAKYEAQILQWYSLREEGYEYIEFLKSMVNTMGQDFENMDELLAGHVHRYTQHTPSKRVFSSQPMLTISNAPPMTATAA